MSGGSFNYLYRVGLIHELRGRMSDVETMVSTLDRMIEAATLSEEQENALRNAHFASQVVLSTLSADFDLAREVEPDRVDRAEDLFNRLRPVWHAVEWYESRDWSMEQVLAEVMRFERRRTMAHPNEAAPALRPPTSVPPGAQGVTIHTGGDADVLFLDDTADIPDDVFKPIEFADQVTVPRAILEENAVSPFDVIREIQRRAAVIERPVTYPRHVTPPGHPPHRFEVLPLSRIETLALPEQPRGRAGRKARRACRKRGGHFWHPADAMIEWGCCVCGHRRDGMPKDGT